MAYRVSQIRRDTTNGKYMEPLSITPTTYTSPDPFLTIDLSGSSSDNQNKNTFSDFALTFNQESDKFFAGRTYYLRFWIQRIPKYWYSGSATASEVGSLSDGDSLSIRLCLAANSNQDEENEPLEVIKDIKVNPYGQIMDNNDNVLNYQYSVYSIVFTPTKDSKILIFRINRNRYDALTGSYGEKRNWLSDQVTSGELEEQKVLRYHLGSESSEGNSQIRIGAHPVRIIYDESFQSEVNKTGDICLLKNIIPNQQTWLKFGYQSRPGNLIVVNGLPIIVGRSGIYEINNGTTIQSFMIAAPLGYISTNIDPFLLDFAYNG